MTLWNFASSAERLLLMLGVFLVLCMQLFYLLWAVEYCRAKRYCFTAVTFVLSFVFLMALCDTDWMADVPMWEVWLILFLLAAFSISMLQSHAKVTKENITRSSIKEAMDDLPIAGCYFTAKGRVKLCNRQMYCLYYAMTRQDLQSLDELHNALEHHVENGIPVTRDGGYVFPDGKVWYFSEKHITIDGESYIETIFTEATEFSVANEELFLDNQELQLINTKLQKLYVRAEDRIREREYLAFKMKIHDDIGRSLAVIRKVMQGDFASGDIEKQIQTLSHAVGTLVYSPESDSPDPYDRLLNEAVELGVEVRLDGMMPLEPLISSLIVRAIRECVTNCVRHAHGTLVFVRIVGVPGGYEVTITNDGEKPKGKIIEGGGLSNLRQSIEGAGGEMMLSHYPGFMMNLTLMREEMEL